MGEHFVPHLVAVTVGSTVHFPNDDRILHNVFSLTPGAVFDLGRYPRGDSASHVFTAPGVVKVFCHLHSHMSAIVRVFDHPYFAVPGKDGRYRLEGLPPGPRSIAAWHERAGVVRREVTVVDGQVAAPVVCAAAGGHATSRAGPRPGSSSGCWRSASASSRWCWRRCSSRSAGRPDSG